MKTVTTLEASDIDLNDPVHMWLLGEVVVISLEVPTAVMCARKKDGSADGEMGLNALKGVIADVLNRASEAGVVITKAEVPEAFREAGRMP